MICSLCRNEKWNQDICPRCGASEKEALLGKAEVLRKDGKKLFAIEAYEEYLQLYPLELEVLKKLVVCLSLETISRFNEELFVEMNEAIRQALYKEWTWKRAHELRIELYSNFGKLENLEKEYEQIGFAQDEHKRVCDDVLKIIQLTKKFKENLPEVSTSLPPQVGLIQLFKNNLILVFIPFVLWAIHEITVIFKNQEKNTYLMFFVFFHSGLIYFGDLFDKYDSPQKRC